MGAKRKAPDTFPHISVSTSSFSPIYDTPPSSTCWSISNRHPSASLGWQSPEPYIISGMLASSPFSPTDKAEHSCLNSRTRKRVRNNRPGEEIVHRNTLTKLYSAQRQDVRNEWQNMPLTPSPSPSPTSVSFHASNKAIVTPDAHVDGMAMASLSSKAQTSLHTFFKTRNRSVSSPPATSATTASTFKSSHPPSDPLSPEHQVWRSTQPEAMHHLVSIPKEHLDQVNHDQLACTDADMMDIDDRSYHSSFNH